MANYTLNELQELLVNNPLPRNVGNPDEINVNPPLIEPGQTTIPLQKNVLGAQTLRSNLDLNFKELLTKKFSIKDFKPKVAEMWGMKYKSGEIAIEHDHWPCAWSGVYYLKGPKDSPGLFFPEMGDQGGERTFETGLLIMFPGHVRHAVRSKKFKGSRYVVAFNVHQHKGNDIYTLLD